MTNQTSSLKPKNIWRCLRQRDYPPDKGFGPGSVDYHDLRLIAKHLRNAEMLDRDMRLAPKRLGEQDLSVRQNGADRVERHHSKKEI